MKIDLERLSDIAAIHLLTQTAFRGVPHSDETEAKIVDTLREAGALTLSLVAYGGDRVLGHAAFSPVLIDDVAGGWFGLGPVSVWPDQQRKGIGSAVITEGLARLRAMKAEGCVVLGDPHYYGRFGFQSAPELCYPGVPQDYFQRLSFTGTAPCGTVAYHRAFDGA